MKKSMLSLLVVSLFLASCAQTGGQTPVATPAASMPASQKDSQPVQPTSTPLPAATATPTAVPTPTPTSLQTLTAEQMGTEVIELFNLGGSCQPPCWAGITPGRTTWDEAWQTLGRFKEVLDIWDYPGGKAGYLVLPVPTPVGSQKITTGGQMTVTIYAVDDIVQQIELSDPAVFPDYTLPALLRRYGPPAEVLISTTNQPDSTIIPFHLILYYPQHGLMATYLDLTEVKDAKLMGCFHYSPGPELRFYAPQEGAAFEQMYTMLTTGSADEYKLLQEVTSLDIPEFTEQLKDAEYPCVETSAKYWPRR